MQTTMQKKKIYKILLWVLVGLCILLAILGYGVYRFGYSMRHLQEGNFHSSTTSPNGTYTFNVYITSPALSSGGTRGEVVNNETNKKRNIYWEYNRAIFEAGMSREVCWENDRVVIINGVRLDVEKDVYDFRRNR